MTKTDFKAEFKEKFPAQLTTAQLWLLVKFAKNVRLRCRSNIAFNNFMNATFGEYATFRQVNKQRPDGTTYPGLAITVKGESEVIEQDED